MLLDLLFPPLCLFCKERGESSFFCPSCWETLSWIDPTERCLHCFCASEDDFCFVCLKKPSSLFPRAYVFEKGPLSSLFYSKGKERKEGMAAFLLYQWIQLDWETPTLIVSTQELAAISKVVAKWLDISCVCEKKSLFLEEETVLFLGEEIEEPSFPKKGFQLTLFGDDHPSFLL